MQPTATPQSLPDLAVSVVLHFSPLEQLQTLLDSISRAAFQAGLSQIEVVLSLIHISEPTRPY